MCCLFVFVFLMMIIRNGGKTRLLIYKRLGAQTMRETMTGKGKPMTACGKLNRPNYSTVV